MGTFKTKRLRLKCMKRGPQDTERQTGGHSARKPQDSTVKRERRHDFNNARADDDTETGYRGGCSGVVLNGGG